MSHAALPAYEAYAIRFASMPRTTAQNFMYREDHESAMPMDFFVWVIKRGDTAVLIDTGFGERSASRRRRERERCPIDTLHQLGVDPANVRDVVLTHLHWDHAGNLDRLPQARFHLQDSEAAYATGRCMCEPFLRRAYAVDDICDFVRRVYDDRVVFHDSHWTLAPGIEVIHVGGHTRGLQFVRVFTARGWVAIASDTAHYYANIEDGNPFPIAYNVADMLAGHRTLLASVDSPDHVVPGHDPDVLRRYPLLEGADATIACLHLDPLGRD